MRGRAGFEKRAAPELARVLEPGESVVASGYAHVQSGWLRTATSGLEMTHFWVVATSRRLILLRLTRVGTAMEVERAEPFGNVRVLANKNRLAARRVTIRAGEDDYPLLFPLGWLKDAEAIAAALGS